MPHVVFNWFYDGDDPNVRRFLICHHSIPGPNVSGEWPDIPPPPPLPPGAVA